MRYEGLMGLRLDSESTGERGDNGNVPKGENAPVGEEGRLSGGVCIPNGAPPAIKLPMKSSLTLSSMCKGLGDLESGGVG